MQGWTLPCRSDPSQPDIEAVAENAQSPLLADQNVPQLLQSRRGGAGNSSKFVYFFVLLYKYGGYKQYTV